jgi:hypothetical protein
MTPPSPCEFKRQTIYAIVDAETAIEISHISVNIRSRPLAPK